MYHNFKMFSTITEHDLRDTIMKILSKSCKLDILTTSLLKRVLDSCLPAITRVFNLSLDKEEFCTNWKTAVVKSFIKSTQNGTVKSNYSPVSNLSFISKAVEKCLLDQFTKHCHDHSLLPEYQSEYQKFYSYETRSLKLVNDILWNMERQLTTAVITFNLSMAFNTVDHDLLLTVPNKEFGIEKMC